MIRALEAAKKECIHQDRLISIIYNCNFTVASLMLQGRLQRISASCSQGQYTIHLQAPSAFTQSLNLTIKWKRKIAESYGHRSLAGCSP